MNRDDMLMKVASEAQSIRVLQGMYKFVHEDDGMDKQASISVALKKLLGTPSRILKALRIHRNPSSFVGDQLFRIVRDATHANEALNQALKASPAGSRSAATVKDLVNKSTNVAALYDRAASLGRKQSQISARYKQLADRALKNTAKRTGIGLAGVATTGALVNGAVKSQKGDAMPKVAYGDPTQQRANEMFNAGVDYRTILNYKAQRNANKPSWWNPFDILGNAWRYGRNDAQQEEWRKSIIERAKAARAKANQPTPPSTTPVQPVSK